MLTDVDTGEPLDGCPVTFTAGDTVLGIATTDSQGTAVCVTRRALLAILRNGGFTASYPGDDAHRGTTVHAGIVPC